MTSHHPFPSRLFSHLFLAFFSAACLLAPMARAAEPGKAPVVAARYMIAAANPHAARAGLAMLDKGGSAVDAAIAAQMVLTLVEPQSSGIGGGAFLLHYDKETGRVDAFDGRETAPAAADEALFLDAAGQPLKFYEAVVGGRSVGVPGLLRMLEMAHKAHGRLPWGDLFTPAIQLAEAGFEVSPRLHYLLDRDKHLRTRKAAAAYFYGAEGAPRPVGWRLKNPKLAESLRRIAAEGADAFYSGGIAAAIVAAVQGDAANPGRLTAADMAAYKAVRREALCRPYRRWRVCGMPPPTSGGVAVLQILGLLEGADMSRLAPGSIEAAHLISQASGLAFADRALYLADSDFVEVPVQGLLAPGYLKARARRIGAAHPFAKAQAGRPDERRGEFVPGKSIELPSTSHLSIVDAWGDAVSMTTSIENAFGSRLMVKGFLLNNQLTDFSFRPEKDGRPVANRVEPGKRPRSSMSPTIVLDGRGGLKLAIGSPGGSRIIGYVAQSLVAVLDWGLDVQAAVDLPHHINRNGPTDLEEGTAIARLKERLEALGHQVKLRGLNSGLHAVMVTERGLEGAADHRREGVVLGR